MTIAIYGLGVGSGVNIAIAKAHRLKQGNLQIEPGHIKYSSDQEMDRLIKAVAIAKEQLITIRNQKPEQTPEELIAIIDTHILMLEDEAITDVPLEIIRQDKCSAEWALQLRKNALITIFDAIDDPYLRGKKDDINQVINRIQRVLLGYGDIFTDKVENRIIVTDDLSPADALLLSQRGIAGFVTEHGGPNSHTAILARGLGIPAVVGAHGSVICLRQGELLILDANTGAIFTQADNADIEYFNDRRNHEITKNLSLKTLTDKPAVTTDGVKIELFANIEIPEDASAAHEAGADGIGLYRTEFLYMNRDKNPDEDEHYAAYMDVLKRTPGCPINIRTLDMGADKNYEENNQLSCTNPALGLRAIRLCLKEPDIFVPQLRAILRASAHGPIQLMIPMLTNLAEIKQTKSIIKECIRQLQKENIECDPDIPIGGMIEVPAAALAAASFAKHLDFLSIGTNDLIQYTLAIDRVDDHVSHLYDPLNPAVIRLIKIIITAANQAEIPVSMCGEMAGDPKYIPLLLALGLRCFSMHPAFLLPAKNIIRQENIEHLTRQGELLVNEMDELDLLSFVQNISTV